MTFRQILSVLWARKLLILAVMVLSLVTAAAIVVFQPRLYESSTVLRTSASVTDAASSGELGGVQVDFGQNTVSSPEILESAATIGGEPGVDYGSLVTVSVESGDQTDTITIFAQGATPESARTRASAVGKAYGIYLQQVIDDTLSTLKDRQQEATDIALGFQQSANADPDDLIVKSNLQSALGTLASVNDSIAQITNSGAPLITLTPAGNGYLLSTGPLIIILLALACGLIAGIGIALIRDQFDDRLRGEYEVESLVDAPALAELPFDPTLRRVRGALPAAAREQSPLGEGLRSLRTALQVLLPSDGAVVTVTSVEPGDGKSFVAANIAVTWANAGKRTILVGGDLRRPALADYFADAAEGPGLTELLLGAALDSSSRTGRVVTTTDVEGMLNDTALPGLRVLPSGVLTVDPADLLATHALAETISALRLLADVIVVDAPPAMALADASLLAKHSDGAIVIATVGRTARPHLSDVAELLRQNGVTVLGAVANRSRRHLPRSYAAYYVEPPKVAARK